MPPVILDLTREAGGPPPPPPAPANSPVRLPGRHMDVYGLQPLHEPQYVVACKFCRKPVLIVAFAAHMDRCRDRIEMQPPPPPVAPPTMIVTAPSMVPVTKFIPDLTKMHQFLMTPPAQHVSPAANSSSSQQQQSQSQSQSQSAQLSQEALRAKRLQQRKQRLGMGWEGENEAIEASKSMYHKTPSVSRRTEGDEDLTRGLDEEDEEDDEEDDNPYAVGRRRRPAVVGSINNDAVANGNAHEKEEDDDDDDGDDDDDENDENDDENEEDEDDEEENERLVAAAAAAKRPAKRLSSTRMGTAEAQKPLRAPPTPPRIVKQKRAKPPREVEDQDGPSVSQTVRHGSNINVLQLGDGMGSVTIMVEGSRNDNGGRDSDNDGVRAGGTPLASRRWTRRNKLTGLSLSFNVHSGSGGLFDDDEEDEEGEDYDGWGTFRTNEASFLDDAGSDLFRFRGGEPSEGWAYTSERKMGPTSPRKGESGGGVKRRHPGSAADSDLMTSLKPTKRSSYDQHGSNPLLNLSSTTSQLFPGL